MRYVLICIMLLIPNWGWAKEVTLSMVYSNAIGRELPFELFSKGRWAPDRGARFVKLHMYFDEPVKVSKIEINNCGKTMDPRLSVFVNFDQWVLDLDPPIYEPKQKGNVLEISGFQSPLEVRSLTWNFEYNQHFFICGMKLLDENGKPYTLKVPRIIQGSAMADSTLKPKQAYDIMNLFDSRFEYGWASNQKAKNVSLNFNFKKKQRIEKIKIWNGYQRSVKHCYANSRAKTIRVTGDSGYSATIQIKDQLGSQTVDLPKPFEGKKLTLKVVDSYAGKNYKDLVISELRFYDGKDWFLLDPLATMQSAIQSNRKQFSTAKVQALLNDGYLAYGEGEDYSHLRLRADGSFYMSGFIYNDEAGETDYFALGNYEIKKAHPKHGLTLRLFGLYYESAAYGDCNGCGRDCNTSSGDAATGKIFQEIVVLKPGQEGKVELTNKSGGKKLKFKELNFTRLKTPKLRKKK